MFIQQQIAEEGLTEMKPGAVDAFLKPPSKDNIQSFNRDSSARVSSKELLDKLERDLENYERQLREMNQAQEQMTREYNQKAELLALLFASYNLAYDPKNPAVGLGDGTAAGTWSDEGASEGGGLMDEYRYGMRFSTITGTIPEVEQVGKPACLPVACLPASLALSLALSLLHHLLELAVSFPLACLLAPSLIGFGGLRIALSACSSARPAATASSIPWKSTRSFSTPRPTSSCASEPL